MPVAAGVVRDEARCAIVAFLDVTAERGGAADADVMKSFPLLR
jgi:hypothetical protein